MLDELRVFRVKAAELDDLLLALQARERRKRALEAQDLVQDRRGEGAVERLSRLLRVHLARGERRGESAADQLRRRVGGLAVAHHSARLAHRGDSRVELRGECSAEALEAPDHSLAVAERAAGAEQDRQPPRKAALRAERGELAADRLLGGGIPRERGDQRERGDRVAGGAAPVCRGVEHELAGVRDVLLAPFQELPAGDLERLRAAGDLRGEAVVGGEPARIALVERRHHRVELAAVVGDLVDGLLPLVRRPLVHVVERLAELREDLGLARLVGVELEAERLEADGR